MLVNKAESMNNVDCVADEEFCLYVINGCECHAKK